MFWHTNSHTSSPMSGVPVVGRYVARSWSSGSGPDPRQPSPARPRRQWRLPAFFRRKFEIAQRGGGRVGSTGPGDSEGGVAVTEEAFKDPPPPEKDPLKDPMRESTSTDPIKDFEATPSPYDEPEIRDVGVREPRYLDLFDPGVSVVRDPKLDEPPPAQAKTRAQSALSTCLAALASTRVIICCSVVLVVLVVVIVVLASTSRQAFPHDPRIQPPIVTTVTTCGLAQGVMEDGAFVFRGLPYAVPPLGKLRFRRSQPHSKLEDCWTGTYIANVTRPCWSYDAQGAVVEGSEDCLLLDVFTPQLGYDTPLPVIVYVGGASLGGDTLRPWLLSKAAKLVKDHRIVFLAPQLRRGPLGFYPHPSLAASTYPHTAGNQGASDLVTALTWTHHNVEHFGGDPEHVTLLGHQAGAALAWPLLSFLRGQNLLHSAWLTGAAPQHPAVPWREADTVLVEAMNCSSVACLEATPARQVMEAPPLVWRRPGHRSWLLADGLVVPFIPSSPQVPLMIGSTEQVAALSLLPWRGRLATSQSQLLDAIVNGLRLNEPNYGQYVRPSNVLRDTSQGSLVMGPWRGGKGWPPPLGSSGWEVEEESLVPGSGEAEEALQWYSEVQDPWLLLTTLVSDATITCPALATAAALARSVSRSQRSHEAVTPIYAYVSRHARHSRTGQVADGTSDIEAILGVFSPKNAEDARFAKTIQNLFFHFITSDSPEWHSATPAHLGVYVVGEEVEVEHSRLQCQHWTNASHFIRRF